jgi:hypothetical protein
MGSTIFGAVDRSPIRPTAPQDMKALRGGNGCATASDPD